MWYIVILCWYVSLFKGDYGLNIGTPISQLDDVERMWTNWSPICKKGGWWSNLEPGDWLQPDSAEVIGSWECIWKSGNTDGELLRTTCQSTRSDIFKSCWTRLATFSSLNDVDVVRLVREQTSHCIRDLNALRAEDFGWVPGGIVSLIIKSWWKSGRCQDI